jgi:hypothetical protein
VPEIIVSGAPHSEKAYFFKEVSPFSFQAEKIKLGTPKLKLTKGSNVPIPEVQIIFRVQSAVLSRLQYSPVIPVIYA